MNNITTNTGKSKASRSSDVAKPMRNENTADQTQKIPRGRPLMRNVLSMDERKDIWRVDAMERIDKLVAEIETLDVANIEGAPKDGTLKDGAPWMFNKHDETLSTWWTWGTPWLIAQSIRQQTGIVNPASSNVTSGEQK
ncbi:hypothetical protein KCU61_g3424, partial [Aureobasidium melanogenum]